MDTNCVQILTGLKFNDLIPAKDIIRDINRVPKSAGVYFWFFRNIPSVVPTEDCFSIKDTKLLYIGISPRNDEGKANLRTRIRMHLGNNADVSTLRVSLGSILIDELNLKMKEIRKNHFNFGESEVELTEWMKENGFLYLSPCKRPWEIEVELINTFSLPLNIQDNSRHPFFSSLRELRADLRKWVREYQ